MPTNAAMHDPNLAAAFGNLAEMFAPPSAQDAASYASARDSSAAAELKKQKLGEIAQLFKSAAMPGFNKDTFDRQNIAAGNYTPTQGYYAVDSTANTSMANNAADNQAKLALPRFSPINQGDVIPAVPSSLAAQFGLPGDLPAVAGLPPRGPTETEVKGGLTKDFLDAGKLTDQQQINLIMGTSGGGERKPPVGYEWAPDGKTLQFIPHGPADPSTAGKTTEATRRNQQLASVITPELHSLLGDGTPQNPGTFDSLVSTPDIVKSNTPGAQALGLGPSGPYQEAQNSLRTIIASYLYSVSGATANPGEVDNLVSVLTPKINEDPKSISDKKARIQQMVEAVQAAATGAPFDMGAAAPAAPGAIQTSQDAPQPGEVVDGFTFNGGDPADPGSWTAAQ